MALWRAEVTIPAAVFVLPDPSSPGAGVPPDASYGFVAVDSTHGYYVNVSAIRNSFGGGPTTEYRTRVVVSVSNVISNDPYNTTAGTVFFTQTDNAANGEAAAGYLSGGTLAIEKDAVSYTHLTLPTSD